MKAEHGKLISIIQEDIEHILRNTPFNLGDVEFMDLIRLNTTPTENGIVLEYVMYNCDFVHLVLSYKVYYSMGNMLYYFSVGYVTDKDNVQYPIIVGKRVKQCM